MKRQERLINRINSLREKRNAVILAHNYQRPEVQRIADHTGDSLGLSRKAATTRADVIVFCGVYFMAETAKILSPEKRVILPDISAGCPMADMITPEQLKELQDHHPNARTLCYVNSSAEIKAMSDICCTSSNAVNIAQKAFKSDEEIIFVPDRHLGNYVASHVPNSLILWPGYCPTHVKMLPEQADVLKKEHPEAELLVHPECYAGLIAKADKVFSTGQMREYIALSPKKEFIIGTENGMIFPLKEDNPEKSFFPLSDVAVCPNMKKIDLEKLSTSLEDMTAEITVSLEIADRARRSIERMIRYS